jgi:hypothetical protein
MRHAVASALLLLVAGCGYRARFDLPPHLHTFTVNTFRNKTLERNLDFEFTEALIHEIAVRTPLRVARPGEGDLVIDGEIDGFERHAVRRKRFDQKMEMRYLLSVNIEIRDTKQNAVFFRGRRIVEQSEISLNLGESPREGRDAVVRELARHVVSLAFELWPPKPSENTDRGG